MSALFKRFGSHAVLEHLSIGWQLNGSNSRIILMAKKYSTSTGLSINAPVISIGGMIVLKSEPRA